MAKDKDIILAADAKKPEITWLNAYRFLKAYDKDAVITSVHLTCDAPELLHRGSGNARVFGNSDRNEFTLSSGETFPLEIPAEESAIIIK